MFKGEYHGALVSPWLILSKEARIVTIFGKVYSSVEVETITGESTPFLAEETFAALMSLADENKKPVKIIVNNRGGSMTAAMLIVDAIEHLQARGTEVKILVIGSCMGVSTAILASGSPGERYALKRALIHLDVPRIPNLKDFDPDDYKRIVAYNDKQKERLYEVLASRTKITEFHREKKHQSPDHPEIGKPEFRRKHVMEFLGGGDTFLSPEEACQAGIIDKVLLPGDPIVDETFKVPKMIKDPGFKTQKEC